MNARPPDIKQGTLQLQLRDGLTIVVPPTLSAITSYVLLEQEAWFEKEIDFLRCFLKPGMTAVDIGANLGVYSLPMALLVGSRGRVFSYEPGGDARALFEQSRAVNDFSNLEIISAALSDSDREGHLAFAMSSELRALDTAGSGEPVHITSLDAEGSTRTWTAVDFIKIDAEGEEERIIAGGREFFRSHSPLVMFEVKAGDKINDRLLELFPVMGYRLFRLLAGAPILVPHDASQPLDEYELNLFAAKPDRVTALSQLGLLAEAIPSWRPDEADRQNALVFWRRQKFVNPTTAFNTSGKTADLSYQDSLAGYATWRAKDQPTATRCAALAFALQSIRAVCRRALTVERASTWARIAWEWGARGESIVALQQLLRMVQNPQFQFTDPFWPVSPRFDDIPAEGALLEWFATAVAEQFERTRSFSSTFGGGSVVLQWLCSQRLASAEMERRRTLIAAHAGLRPRVPERLRIAAPDHRNARIWHAGLVPGTVLGT